MYIHPISYILEALLGLLVLLQLGFSFFNKDRARIWCPMTAVSLTYLYYCLIPFWGGTTERFAIDESVYNGPLFHFSALSSYCATMIGFYMSSNSSFKKWNSYIDETSAGKYGLILFAWGIICYGLVRGFHLTFGATPNSTKELSTGGFTYYFMMMLDMLPFAAGLLFVKSKSGRKNWPYLVPLWFIVVDFIVAGARWRVVVMLFVLLTVHHLYPRTKRINVLILVGLFISVFLFFSVMDKARIRGSGIDFSVVQELKFDDIKGGAAENQSVYWFSVICMDHISKTGNRVYFDPLISSLLMPIPRFLFPWKPDSSYVDGLDEKLAEGGGAAYLSFVESYYSFGWIGILFWAWLLGWLARKFWGNYLNNRNSLGAILALGTFSGFCYVCISRGYLPATFTTFILAICLPFWIIGLFRKNYDK